MKNLLHRVLNKIGLLELVSINAKLNLNDTIFKIPVIKKIGFKNLTMSEIWMIDLLKILLKDTTGKNLFVDVGVNIGQTLLRLRSISKEINYLGFEPNPLCNFYVNELIKANPEIKKSNTTIYPVGVSTENQLLSLNLYTDNEADGTASIIEEFREDQKIIQKMIVPVFDVNKIDNDSNLFNDVSIIKIDVEGAELEVLTSLKDIINRERPNIIIEILPVYKESNSFRIQRQKEIESMFTELNYSIYRIEKSNELRFSHLVNIKTIGIHSNLNLCDYLIIPTENNKFTSYYGR